MGDVLTIDGVSARSPVFGISTRTGRYSVPNKRGDNVVLPGRSGSIWTPNKTYEEGVGALSCWVVGARHANGEIIPPASTEEARWFFERNMDQVMRFFTQSHKLSTLRSAQPLDYYAAPGTPATVRTAKVEWREWTEPEVQAGGTRAEWAIAYTIPGVWWEDEIASQNATPADSTLPKTLDLTNFAGMTGVLEDAILTVQGPITAPRITVAETGAYVEFSGSLTSTQTWTVDAGLFTSNKSGTGSVLQQTTHVGSYRLLTIPNNFGTTQTPRLVLSGSGGGTTTALTVNGRKKWVSG